jgi:hypothetical protein
VEKPSVNCFAKVVFLWRSSDAPLMKGMVCRIVPSEDNTVRLLVVVPRLSEFPGIAKILCYRIHFDSCFQQQGPGRYDLYLCYPNGSQHCLATKSYYFQD